MFRCFEFGMTAPHAMRGAAVISCLRAEAAIDVQYGAGDE
jgi:hypothetical protein